MRRFYLWYLGTLIFIIPIIFISKDDNVDNKPATNQMSDSDNAYIFYPNDKCTTIVYNDAINCGNSKASLLINRQNFIWCKFNVSNAKIIDEPFVGVEIWLKDTNYVKNISNYDYIELNMIVLNRDGYNGPFTMHCHSRLKNPENLPPIDTLSCDDSLKKSNLRHPYSVKYKEIKLQKNKSIYSNTIDSFTTPPWYNNSVTYTEDFDKERFFSLSIQTGSNFPANTEFNVIISSIIFKKNIQTQPNLNSTSVHKSHQIILFLSIISGVLYLLIITLLIRIRYNSNADKDEKKQIIFPYTLPTDIKSTPTQSFKPEDNSNPSDNVSNIVADISLQIRPKNPPLPLDGITINVLRKIAENPKLSTDDVAKDNNKDSSTICKKIERDFGKGITISKLRLYFSALDIRNKNIDIHCDELHNHANKVITDAHGKLNSYKDLQDISATLQQKCPNDILDFFKQKYGDINF
jgi:hypothetical protein